MTPEQEINLVQIPHPFKAMFKFPPPRAWCTVKCPEGGGMLNLQFDRYISLLNQQFVGSYSDTALTSCKFDSQIPKGWE